MRRAPIVLAATAAGLAATLGFRAQPAAPTSAAAVSTSTSASGRTVTSDAIATRYGNVELRVTISGGKLTNVEAVQLPSTDPKSSEISSSAEPLLRQSALAKQSAGIDAVSGATYTSEGYKTALQSALDKAGFKSSSATAG